MSSSVSRSRPASQTPAKQRASIPTEQELQLLISYVRGYLTLEEANELLLLYKNGRFIITVCTI